MERLIIIQIHRMGHGLLPLREAQRPPSSLSDYQKEQAPFLIDCSRSITFTFPLPLQRRKCLIHCPTAKHLEESQGEVDSLPSLQLCTKP